MEFGVVSAVLRIAIELQTSHRRQLAAQRKTGPCQSATIDTLFAADAVVALKDPAIRP
jgi:hypothetical protein